MIWLLLGWPLLVMVRRAERRRAAVELARVEAVADELRSRIECAAPLWRREDDAFPGSRW